MRWVVLFCWVLFLGARIGGAADFKTLPEQYQGSEALKRGDASSAQKHFEKALEKDPTNLEIQYNLGTSAYQAGDFDRAVESFKAVSAGKKIELAQQAFYNLGNSYYRKNELQPAIDAYTEALKLNPNDEEARLNLEFVKKKLEEKKQQPPSESKSESQSGSKSESKPESKPEQKSQSQSESKSGSKSESKPQSSDSSKSSSEKQSGSDSAKKNNSQENQDSQGSQNSKNESPEKKDPKPNDSSDAQDGQKNPKKDPSQKPDSKPPSEEEKKPEPKGELKPEHPLPTEKGQGEKASNKPAGTQNLSEAERVLSTVDENSSEILKKQIQQKMERARRPKKDW